MGSSEKINSAIDHGDLLYDTFPKGFLWGMGTAAAQCEGGWDQDGRGPSIWDDFVTNHPERVLDDSSCKVALQSYKHYKEDVKMLKAIDANIYRFSLSWSRLLPTGRVDNVNQAGVDYYNSLINELLANGIQPMITIYHWDIPQALLDSGIGWLNEKIVDIFGEFSRFCFEKFGDRVTRWTTINEPWVCGMATFALGMFPPQTKEQNPEEHVYIVGHNLLKAHAVAYRIYEKEFKQSQKGVIGITLDTACYLPHNPESKEDIEAAHRAFTFRMGWMLDPLYNGKYPKAMRDNIDRRSKAEGRENSRLPEFDQAWSEKIKGSVDFIGINFYNAELVTDGSNGKPMPDGEKWAVSSESPLFTHKIPGWCMDLEAYRCQDLDWTRCGSDWQDFAPGGIRNCLKWVSDNYRKPSLMVTETGYSSTEFSLNDPQRADYFKLSINGTLKAIKEDGCNVVGYVGWSLLDVWEWIFGHTTGFGIVQVDRTSPNMTRTLKDSGKYVGTIFRNNGFLPPKGGK